MALTLTKVSEAASTITLGWTPPANVGGYVLYANGQVVSVATANLKDGSPRREAKFSKTDPGPPYEVAATCRQGEVLVLQTGTYPSGSPPVPGPGQGISQPTAVVT